MKQSMKTLESERLKQNEEEIYKQVIEASKTEEEELLKKVLEESKKDFPSYPEPQKEVPPIQQVADMGYPMELVLQAYANVGDDVEKMLDYIFKILG